jgi:hypothetical protein
MDHPALPAPSSALQPPTLPYTLAKFGTEKPSHLRCGVLSSGSHLWFLGQLHYRYPDAGWPDELADILAAREPLTALSRYASLLHTAGESGDLPFDALAFEAWSLNRFTRRLVDRYIEPNIQHVGDNDHWVWQPSLRRKHPVINYSTSHDVLAVRLCWAYQKPGTYLPADKNPIKISGLCPDDGHLNACVNAEHYYVSYERTDPAPNLAIRRGMSDGRPAKTQVWRVDEGGTVVCERSGHAMSVNIQYRYQQGGEAALHQREHCPGCWADRMAMSGGLGKQRRGTGSYYRDLAAAQEIERKTHQRAWDEGRYNPSGEPTPIRDADEPREWTEEDFQI